MKNYDILYTNGCSFTRGDRLPNEETWPELLSEKLNLPLINNSRNAQSMDSIASKTISDVLDYQDKKILVIIGMTWPDRYSLKFGNILLNWTSGDFKHLNSGLENRKQRLIATKFTGIHHIIKGEDNKNIRPNMLYKDDKILNQMEQGYESKFIAWAEKIITPYVRAVENHLKHDDSYMVNKVIQWYETILQLKSFLETLPNVEYRVVNFQSHRDKTAFREDARNAVKKYRKLFQQDKNVLWVSSKIDISKASAHPSKEGCITLRDIIYDSVNR